MEVSPDRGAKRDALDDALRAAGRVLIAFSGGVDSSYLAYAAHRVLGEDALAVTAESPSYPASHRSMAERITREFGIPHRFVATHELANPSYRVNAPDRCYHCKTELFDVSGALPERLAFDAVAYGVNVDATADFRPGHRAANERGVL